MNADLGIAKKMAEHRRAMQFVIAYGVFARRAFDLRRTSKPEDRYEVFESRDFLLSWGEVNACAALASMEKGQASIYYMLIVERTLGVASDAVVRKIVERSKELRLGYALAFEAKEMQASANPKQRTFAASL